MYRIVDLTVRPFPAPVGNGEALMRPPQSVAPIPASFTEPITPGRGLADILGYYDFYHVMSGVQAGEIFTKGTLTNLLEKPGVPVEAKVGADKVTTLTGFSQVLLRGLPLESFDIIYVDGSHVKNDVLEDAVLSWRLLKNGGLMVFDDYRNLGVGLDYAGGHGPDVWSPKAAIDPFVQCFERQCEVLHNGRQLIIRKKV